jgi:hypothetical protein
MPNPINRVAVCSALGLAPDQCNADVFKQLVKGGFLPAPLDAAYDTFDLTAVQAKIGSAASIVAAAGKIVTEHRGGQKAIF